MSAAKDGSPALIDKVLRTPFSLFILLSGALISVAVNLYTSVFINDLAPTRWRPILAASMLTMISSILFGAFAWQLEEIQRLFAIKKTTDTWEMLVAHRRCSLMLLLAVAVLLAVAGMILLSSGVDFVSKKPSIEFFQTHPIEGD